MITSEGPDNKNALLDRGDGYSATLTTNGNGGVQIRQNQLTNFVSTEPNISYNVGFGSTMPTASWVKWTAAEFEAAGLSTTSSDLVGPNTSGAFDPTLPDSKRYAQIDVESSNIWTTSIYGDTTGIKGKNGRNRGFFDLYETADDRKARHKALREAGYSPPFPRADKFLQNKHQSVVRAGVTTEGSY